MHFLNGHDIGNHTDKHAFITAEGSIRVVATANEIGAGDVGTFNVSIDGLVGRRTHSDEPDVVVYDSGITVMVGEHVERFTRKPIRRTDLNRYGDGMATRAITYNSWYHLLGPGEHHVHEVLGLPLRVINAEDFKARRRAIRRWLRGTHEFAVNGEPCVVHVDKIKFVAQPVGAFAEFAMDTNANLKEAELLDVEIAVLDPGYQTVDTFVLKGGQVDRTTTAGDSIGMREAVRLLVHQVQEMHGRKLSDFEADRMVREHVVHPRSAITITARGRPVDITPLIQTSIKMTTDAVIDFLDELWGDGGEFRYVLLVGGGSLVMGDALREKFPHAILLDEPVTANVRGLAKIARQMFG